LYFSVFLQQFKMKIYPQPLRLPDDAGGGGGKKGKKGKKKKK